VTGHNCVSKEVVYKAVKELCYTSFTSSCKLVGPQLGYRGAGSMEESLVLGSYT
jgi:hypothetical protein